MIDLILIIIIIISLVDPEILLSKKVKDKASYKQKKILSNNIRKIYAILVGFFETLALTKYIDDYGIILMIIFIILILKISLPAAKENKRIVKDELNL